MRHKQRPVKSSRHKSVTFIIDSHTSFGDHNEAQQQQHANNSNQQHHYRSPHHPILPSMQHHHQQASRAPRLAPSYHSGGSASSAGLQSGSSAVGSALYQQQQFYHSQQHTTTTVATNDDQPPMRKQFEHNYRHMSDVMRLAFLENNDISIDDCSNIDFNSLSTASILQRNIQQQLQQERRDQLQLRQQEQQQQRQQQFNQRLQNKHRLKQHQQQRDVYEKDDQEEKEEDEEEMEEEEEEELDDEYNDPEDFHLSDSRIFATATSTSSSNRTSLNYGTHRNMQQPGSSGVAGHRIVGVSNAVSPSASGSRKRTRDSMQHVEFSDHVQVETIQNNNGKGFFCDEPGCGKSFPSLRKLRHHKVVHSDDFPFVCEFRGCGKKFKRKFGIDLHSTTHFDLDPEMYSKTSNNSSLPFFGRRMQYSMCKPCGQKFKTVHEYQYHMLKHGKEPFKCPVKGCGQTFGIWKSFQKHRASHYFNYYCKMDPSCDHHTSNLQLLKLHIYCCHFRRKLPDNATLSSKDPPEEDSTRDDHVEVVHEEQQQQQQQSQQIQPDDFLTTDDSPTMPTASTPRRDSRLRKNPPRSSTFGQQDYASINNGSTYAKSLSSTPQPKRTRSTAKQQSQQPQQQLQQQQKQQQFAYELDDDYGRGNDYEISDSGIFATATPTTSSSRNTITSTPRDLPRSVSINSKKRAKESMAPAPPPPLPRVEIQSQGKEVVRKFKDGFLCDEPGCGKSFPSLRKLRHHKVVHSDDFPFVCEFRGCGKKFKRKFGIDLHSTTHFDLDPEMYSKTSNNSSLPFFGRRIQYSMCKPCGQKFRTVHEYQYHMLKHGKEPFKCPVKGCGQTFGIWKSFQKHRASHYFNYYCKMDPSCDHHTSNLQLLKLHIYCCHFRRKLPDNATLSSKDPPEEEPIHDEQIDIKDNEDSVDLSHEEKLVKEEIPSPVSDPISKQQIEVTTPRRDSRLRKNPPRSSAFGQQDYASINNGGVPAKSSLSTSLQLKRTRAAISSSSFQSSVGSQSAPPTEKKVKLPLKILPKRSAQRLPMSLIADDASTEDDEGHSSDSYSNERDEEDADHDPAKRNRFKCHLCDYKFSVRFQLTKHLSTHLELTPEMYSATADKQVVQLSERRRREFYCDKCTVKFEHMPDLDTHMRKHGQRPYVCNFCQAPSTFRLAKQYLSHLYEHRFNYKCTMAPDCDFTINRKDALKLHIFRMHLNQQLPSYIENFASMIDCNEWSEQ